MGESDWEEEKGGVQDGSVWNRDGGVSDESVWCEGGSIEDTDVRGFSALEKKKKNTGQ